MTDKKKKTPNRNTFVKGLLRRGSFHWKPRTEAFKAARVERGKYKCAICLDLFGPKEVALDHIHPVVDPRTGFTGFDDYIERLFCDEDSFQVICHGCHESKTKIELSLREHYKTERDEVPDLKKKSKSKKSKKKVDEDEL